MLPRDSRISAIGYFLLSLSLMAFFASSASAAMLDVTAPPYNAAGDGVSSDRAAIQAAIDDASQSQGVDTVYLPPGTYLLDERAPGRGLDPTNARTALLWLPSDVTIEGAGASSILLVGPGLNDCDPLALPRTGGFSVFQGLEGVATDDIVLRQFAIDGNAANNPLPDPNIPGCDQVPAAPHLGNFNRAGRFVTILEGSRLLIEECSFLNSNSRQIIRLGDDANPGAIFDIQILNNIFTDHAQDARQNDHSSVYAMALVAAQSLNLVEGNTFINTAGSNGSQIATALEIHGSDTRVEDNLVRYYRLGANVIASVLDSVDNIFYDNDFRAVSSGFHLWSVPPFELVDTTIEANWVEQAFVKKGDNLIDWKVAFSPIRGLMIKNNILTSSVLTVDVVQRKGAGIAIYGFTHDVSIIGNIISRTECEGIRIAGPRKVPGFLAGQVDLAAAALNGTSWVDGLVIQDNRIRDPGSWGSTSNACAIGVHVISHSEPTDYKMRDIQMTSSTQDVNRIRYVSDSHNQPSAYAGVRLRGIIEDSTFSGIEMLDSIGVDFETPGGADFDQVIIDHHDVTSSSTPAAQNIRACAGSEWRTSSGLLWIKTLTASCDSFSDWQLSLGN